MPKLKKGDIVVCTATRINGIDVTSGITLYDRYALLEDAHPEMPYYLLINDFDYGKVYMRDFFLPESEYRQEIIKSIINE